MSIFRNFIRHLLASAMVGRKKFSKAITIYKSIWEKDKEDTFALSMIAQCYEWMGEDERASQHAKKILEYDPRDFRALQILANYHAAKEKFDQAYGYICRALECPSKHENLSKIFGAGYLVKGFNRVMPRRATLTEAQKGLDKTFQQDLEWLEWATKFKEWYEEQNNTSGNILNGDT